MWAVLFQGTLLALLSLNVAEAAVITQRGTSSTCTNPLVRKEWRSLSTIEKKAYIDAVLCLQQHPAITKEQFKDNPWVHPINRYDDFQAVHHNQTLSIHFVGHFLLWHRYMVSQYERTLREVCGYPGAQPYWDYSRDASHTDNSSMAGYQTDVFSPTIGFGGNGAYVETGSTPDPYNFTGDLGRTGGGCVLDGPFTLPHFSVNVNRTDGPGACLKRDFSPRVLNYYTLPEGVELILAQPDYTSFDRAIEGHPDPRYPNIHSGGHFGVGGLLGQAGSIYNSPGEPLFYLHHSNLDSILWLWQKQDPEKRLHEVGGPVKMLDYGGVNVTLDFEVDLGVIAGSVKLGDLLDTQGSVLCYVYER